MITQELSFLPPLKQSGQADSITNIDCFIYKDFMFNLNSEMSVEYTIQDTEMSWDKMSQIRDFLFYSHHMPSAHTYTASYRNAKEAILQQPMVQAVISFV